MTGNQAKIVGLERLRGFAALFVMAHHFSARLFPSDPVFLLPLRFGQEVVMLFFVISGFVIH